MDRRTTKKGSTTALPKHVKFTDDDEVVINAASSVVETDDTKSQPTATSTSVDTDDVNDTPVSDDTKAGDKKTRSSWTYDETLKLLDARRKYDAYFRTKPAARTKYKRNYELWDKIVLVIQKHHPDFPYNSKQCLRKFNNMVTRYRRLCKTRAPKRNAWAFYAYMKQLDDTTCQSDGDDGDKHDVDAKDVESKSVHDKSVDDTTAKDGEDENETTADEQVTEKRSSKESSKKRIIKRLRTMEDEWSHVAMTLVKRQRTADMVMQLRELSLLYACKQLTEAEFDEAKRKVLST